MDPNNQGYGQAQGYYNGQQQYNNAPPQKQYQQYEQGPPPQQFQQQQYQQYDNGGPGPQEQMPNPPSYGQNYSSPDGKAGFEQTFKVERPKWNDVRNSRRKSSPNRKLTLFAHSSGPAHC